MWQKSRNCEDVRPLETERTGNCVIVRQNIHRVAEYGDESAHYEYDEWQMTVEQFEVYKSLRDAMHDQEDALIELAGIISEVM